MGFCVVPCIHCAFQEPARHYGNWSLIWPAFSLFLIGCLEVRVQVLSSLSPVVPSRWKQLSVGTFLTYPVRHPWHMPCNWFHCNQFLPLPFILFASWHQSDHFKLRLHNVILLLKKTGWLLINDRTDLYTWWALLHHPASGHDEDVESKPTHDGQACKKQPFLLSAAKASSITSAKLSLNCVKL